MANMKAADSNSSRIKVGDLVIVKYYGKGLVCNDWHPDRFCSVLLLDGNMIGVHYTELTRISNE
jgi:hypothetical protein